METNTHMSEQDNSSSSSDSDSIGWEELETEQESVLCLFCSDVFDTVTANLQHCVEIHNFNLTTLKHKFNMDCYSFIKLINYIRKNKVPSDEVMACSECLWADDIYYSPVLENDSWLLFDFEEFFETGETNESYDRCISSEVEMDTSEVENNVIKELRRELQKKNEMIELLTDGMRRMQQQMQKMIGISDDDDNDLDKRMAICSGNSSSGSSGAYFGSYEGPSIHQEMIEDKVRTDTYKCAIQQQNGINVKGKIVLDLGCGTGILSLFAAEAGASKVYAVDNSSIIHYTMEIIRANKFEDVIVAVKKPIEDDRMPFVEVDVIVSEWMGYFLLFEGMLDSLIHARDGYLKSGGLLMPNRCSMHLCGSHLPELHDKAVKFWSNVHGFDMRCIARDTQSSAVVHYAKEEQMITSSCQLRSFDLYTCKREDTEFTASFSLTSHVEQPTQLTTLVGYFKVFFDVAEPVQFSTSPSDPTTHWEQTLFHLPEPFTVRPGELINGEITCCKHKKYPRSLDVKIKIRDLNLQYFVE